MKLVMPKPGMLGTMFVGSDRYIVICAHVLSPKKVVVITDCFDFYEKYKDLIIERDGCQFIPNELRNKLRNSAIDFVIHNGIMEFMGENIYSLRKNGKWFKKGENCWGTGFIKWGIGENYIDPEF